MDENDGLNGSLCLSLFLTQKVEVSLWREGGKTSYLSPELEECAQLLVTKSLCAKSEYPSKCGTIK